MASVLMNKGTGSGARPCKYDSQHCSTAACRPIKPPWGPPHIAFPHFLKCPLLQSAGSYDLLIRSAGSRWAERRLLLTMGGLRRRGAAALLPDKHVSANTTSGCSGACFSAADVMNYYQYVELSHHTTTKTTLVEISQPRTNLPVRSGHFLPQFIKIKNKNIYYRNRILFLT